MAITNRQYSRDGYHGRVYVSSTDPAQDPDVTVKDGDEWHVPGSVNFYIRYGNAWYRAEIYGAPEDKPSTGVPGQKFIEVLSNGQFGQMYIVPPNGTSFVLFQPQHALSPDDGVHTGKLHIKDVEYHVPQEKTHRRVAMLAAIMASRAIEVA